VNCRHAGLCGGCSLLHLRYDQQLASKEALLRRLHGPALAHGKGTSGPLFLPVPHGPDPAAHIRQKVAFAFAPDPSGRGVVMGHYRRGSQRIVRVEECAVHSARGNRIAFAMRDCLASGGVSAAGPSLSGIVRHLIVRTTADEREAVAMLVVTRNDRSLRRPMRALLESEAAPDGLFININAEPGPFMVGDDTIHIGGRSHVREAIGSICYLISPTAFFQTNTRAAAVLQNYVVRSLAGASRVLDLYCGSGLFSLPLAAAGSHVTGVEENPQAIADARRNARLNQVRGGRTRFIAARVEDALRQVGGNAWDAVILDPPRQGCSDEVLETIFQEVVPPRVTYVSCNPQSLSAELPGITACGYRVEELRAVDMFPNTEHVEVVVQLRRT